MSRLSTSLATLAVAAAALVPLIWPGDTPWINDEPLLLRKALDTGLVVEGLRGTVGMTYGPVPTWIYALLVRVSRDPVTLVLIRAALFMAATSLVTCWLLSLTRRSRWYALLPLLSPYLWLYARQLWDNTFLIPLGALAFTAYLSFCARPSRGALWVTVLALTACVLTHPMVVPLGVAVTGHALLFHRGWLRAHRGTVAAALATCVLVAAPWFVAVARDLAGVTEHVPPPPPPLRPPPDPPQPAWMPLFFPLLGGRLLSAQGIEYFFGDPWFARARFMLPFALLSWGGHFLVWAGMVLAARRVRDGLRDAGARDLAFHGSALACATLIGSWLLQAIAQRNTHPHYYNGGWIAFVWFAWTATDALPRLLGRLTLGALAASLSVVLAFLIVDVHRTAGNRSLHFGSTLATQLEVVRRLGRAHPTTPIVREVPAWLMFPHALPVLRELAGAGGDPAGDRRPLRVRYRDPAGRDGWLTVENAD